MLFEGNAKIANRYFKKQLGVLKEGDGSRRDRDRL